MLIPLALQVEAPSAAPRTELVVPQRVHPRRLLVRVDRSLDAVRLEALCTDLGVRELWNLPQIGWRALEVRPGCLAATKQRLENDPAVLEVHFDPRRELAYTPNDPLYGSQWHMGQIKANLAWDTEKGDPSVVVAVMDTGIQLTHPDLVGSLWTNPGEIAGNLIDDDLNGYVDDVRGYDFANFDSDPSDDNSHGTACAGIIAAVQDNSIGVTGVAPLCKVAAVKAALSTGFFYASANVPALIYCADMGFDVISMSFFSDEVIPAERDAIAYCWDNGVLPVVAAGNDNSVLPYYPAAYPQSLSVGATSNSSDTRAYFSNWGSWVNVAAPGLSLTTTYLGSGYTGSFAGTSGATPHVAGIAALLFSANGSATNADVRAAIEDSALLLSQAPYGYWSNYGRVDADAALDRILGITSGSVPARLLFAAPCGGQGEKFRLAEFDLPGTDKNQRLVPLEVSGVGLETPNTVQVLRNGNVLPLLSQERHSVSLSTAPNPGLFLLKRNGSPVQSWTWEGGPGLLYAATDGSTLDQFGSSASGGWLELYRQDGVNFTCTENSSAQIYCEFAVRKVTRPSVGKVTLEFNRDYDGMNASPIETIELYDWSSFSYPYGTWITLSSAAAPTAGFSTLSVTVPGNANQYRDEEGTYYLRLATTNAGASGQLKADMLRLRVRAP